MTTPIAFVFPGQGSQKLGMLNTFADVPEVRFTFTEASEVMGQDLWALSQTGPEEKLNDTRWTQPLLLTASVALWRFWQSQCNVKPAWMAGHSLGEYSALVCANALSLADWVKLVHQRGTLMAEAVPPGQGAMAAILGLDKATVVDLCAEVEEEVCEAVNYNSPEQTVIAGTQAGVQQLIEKAKAAGAKRALLLPVSVPSHCALMKPAAALLERYFEEFANLLKKPEYPILHNVDVATHAEPAALQAALISQLYFPVRWVETIETLAQQGVTTFVECGPGKVLSGLNKRICREAKAVSLENLSDFESLLESLLTGI